MKIVTSALTACVAHASKILLLLAAGCSSSLLAKPASVVSGAESVESNVQYEYLVLGAFRSEQRAQRRSLDLTERMGVPVSLVTTRLGATVCHRLQTEGLPPQKVDSLVPKAQAAGLSPWRSVDGDYPMRLSGTRPGSGCGVADGPAMLSVAPRAVLAAAPRQTKRQRMPGVAPIPGSDERPDGQTGAATPFSRVGEHATRADQAKVPDRLSTELDLGLQSRLFAEAGFAGQRRIEGSISLELEHYRTWDSGRKRLTVTPFLRLDSQDSDRTHFDLRELFWTFVGEDWDVHVGARRVFWGVTEFNHLVDVVNQTDLVENIDTEDKLGQPMLQLSLVRDWGTLDVFALTGFRQRTFAGRNGRFRGPLEISDGARYESGAAQHRTDFALRWTHRFGPFEVGVHHFSGTSRDPMFLPAWTGESAVRPYYPVIDQSGVDALAINGDWSFKFEGMSRSGFGDRYGAFNLGVERTLVGVFDSSADFGFVAEFMYDERGDEAFNSLFEHDLALGGRFALNDFADTKALIGVIADTRNSDLIFSLEASRQLGPDWFLSVEGRVFQGGRSARLPVDTSILEDPDFKSAWLQGDDYLQIEFKKYF